MLKVTLLPSMKNLTTIGIGGNAKALIDIFDENDLEHINAQVSSLDGIIKVLGGGSNILAVGDDLPFILVRSQILKEPEILQTKNNGEVLVKVYSAMGLGRFLAWCSKNGFGGMENLAGIPGTVGGAIAGNAGSYGSAMGDRIKDIDVYFFKDGHKKLQKSDTKCSYRYFSIGSEPGSFIIVSATVSLYRESKAVIVENIRTNVAKKADTQPVRLKSAGCVFKNPENSVSAGKLLDEIGFRGKKKEGLGFSSIHANFLVNEGLGNGETALGLIKEARDAVSMHFGIELQTEVQIWAC